MTALENAVRWVKGLVLADLRRSAAISRSPRSEAQPAKRIPLKGARAPDADELAVT